MRCYVHVLRRDKGDVLRRALEIEKAGRKGRGRPNKTWKRLVEEHINRDVEAEAVEAVLFL